MLKENNNGNKNMQDSIANINVLVTRLFQLVLERKFVEAENTIEKLKTKITKNEWNHGYIGALNGIILTQKSTDERYAFLANFDFNDEKAIEKNLQDFQKFVQHDFFYKYDRGFFSAWADFFRMILKTKKRIN